MRRLGKPLNLACVLIALPNAGVADRGPALVCSAVLPGEGLAQPWPHYGPIVAEPRLCRRSQAHCLTDSSSAHCTRLLISFSQVLDVASLTLFLVTLDCRVGVLSFLPAPAD